MKTFLAMGLKSQAQDKKKEVEKEEEKKKKKEKEEKKKDKKKKDSFVQKDAPTIQKDKSKPFEEIKKKKKNIKKRPERSTSAISEEIGVNKRRLLKLVEESYSLSSAEDETSAIAIEPMTATAPTAKLASRVSRPIQRGMVIREPIP